MRLVAGLVIVSLLTGCASMTPARESGYSQMYRPVLTPELIAQARGGNPAPEIPSATVAEGSPEQVLAAYQRGMR